MQYRDTNKFLPIKLYQSRSYHRTTRVKNTNKNKHIKKQPTNQPNSSKINEIESLLELVANYRMPAPQLNHLAASTQLNDQKLCVA